MQVPHGYGLYTAARSLPVRLAKRTLFSFFDDDCMPMAAGLAYYTIFSLPPLLVIIVQLAGFFFGVDTIRMEVHEQAGRWMGPSAAAELESMLEGARSSGDGLVATVVGTVALLFGATTAFAQLQTALNRTWGVRVDSDSSAIRNFLFKRLMSFGLILVLGFLLLVSLILSAVLAAAGSWLERTVGGWVSSPLLEAINVTLSFALITLLFAAMFRYLPDAVIAWRDVLVGAVLTAALFVLGKSVLGNYLGSSGVAEAYGTAGSVILILMWVYYSSVILLLGAEFTQAWAIEHGRSIHPEEGAIKVKTKEAPVPTS